MPIDHELRRLRIGGSDAAAVAGVDPERDPFDVYADKRGLLERAAATPRMRLGKHFEQGIIAYYSEVTGREARFLDDTRIHPEYPFLVWTPDAECIHESRGVDAKYIAWDQHHQWGETADEIPVRVQCQAHWYMAASGVAAWDIAAVLGSDDFRVYTVERDPEVECWLLEAAEEFWRRYLIGNEVPRIGATADSARYLRRRFPKNVSAIRKATEEEAALLEEYAITRKAAAQVEEIKERIENALKACVGDADGISWPKGRFTWKLTADSTKVDWEAVAHHFMRDFTEENRKRVEKEYSFTKPGTRRIYFYHKED